MPGAKRSASVLQMSANTFASTNTWIKRSLHPSEWLTNPFASTLFIPRFGNERILNEAACMRFIADTTNIPLPQLYGCFEDDGAAPPPT